MAQKVTGSAKKASRKTAPKIKTGTQVPPKSRAANQSSTTPANVRTTAALKLPTVRQVKPPKRRQDRRFRQRPKLPGAFRLAKLAASLLYQNWKPLGGIVLVYALLNILLVHGLNTNVSIKELRDQTAQAFKGGGGHLAAGLTVFGILLTGSNNSGTAVSGPYQSALLIITSLALVWTLRQRLAGVAVRVRDGFYHGMYPLIPVLLVLCMVGLQSLPLLIGLWLYSAVVAGGVATNLLEIAVTLLVVIALVVLSIYWLCSSLFALYIVTLPGMTPLKALRSSRELVRYRRWPLIRKLLFLPLVLTVVGAIIMLPFILFAAAVAQYVFFLYSVTALAAIHAYMYLLYREMLKE